MTWTAHWHITMHVKTKLAPNVTPVTRITIAGAITIMAAGVTMALLPH